jgi:hypothetical protein
VEERGACGGVTVVGLCGGKNVPEEIHWSRTAHIIGSSSTWPTNWPDPLGQQGFLAGTKIHHTPYIDPSNFIKDKIISA